MAISTYKTYLMHKTSGRVWEKLLDITSFPDLGGEPETIDVTTLSDAARVFIRGIQESESLTFGNNYTHEDYAKVNALSGSQEDYAVWFGATGEPGSEVPTGSEGKFSFKGDISARIVGGGVNEAVGMQTTIIPSTIIKDETEAA